MSPPSRARCQICSANESKYTCSSCLILYCSIPCYKQHKESSCAVNRPALPKHDDSPHGLDAHQPEPPLRPLTSLNWPYVPEQSAYPDPLKRDDPKMLQLHQYEAIATSPSVRERLAENPNLKNILRSVDKLRGNDRDEALQRALGVLLSGDKGIVDDPELTVAEEDVQALRRLAEAIESAVRGGSQSQSQAALGLDWGE